MLGLSAGLMVQPVFGGELDEGFAAISQGDYATALRLLQPLKGRGDAWAAAALANMYENGDGVSQDLSEATQLYLVASALGSETLQKYSLGVGYEDARGVVRDYAEELWRRGEYDKALKLFLPLAKRGNSSAQVFVGLTYEQGIADGRGVAKDYAEAVKWFRLAADQGDADGQYSLGISYWMSEGVLQDYAQAHMWFNLAAAGYDASETEKRATSIRYRDEIATRMTADQIAEAQRLAREWLIAHATP